MKSTNLIAVIAVLASLTAQAQQTDGAVAQSTASTKGLYQQLKDGPLDFSFNLETDTARRSTDNKIRGVDQTNRFYLGYKLTPNDKVRVEARTTHTNPGKEDPTVNSFNRAVLKYSRSNILTEAKHGVSAKFDVEYRYLPDFKVRNSAKRYSHVRVGPTFAKSAGDFSADIGFFYARNQAYGSKYNELKGFEDRQKGNWYVPLSQTYKFTEKLSANIAEEWMKTDNYSNINEKVTLDLTAEVGYQFSDVIYVGVSATGQPVSQTDGKKTVKDYAWNKDLTYGVNFNFDVF